MDGSFETPSRRAFCTALAVCVCALSTGGCATGARPQAAAGPSFSALTYNVNYGGVRPELAVAAIAEADADVVVLQETNPQWEQWLRGGLGDRYPHAYFHHAPAAGGIALLSKGPVRAIRFYLPTAGWFPACIATVETPLGPVQFVGVHLRPPVSDRGSFVSGYFSTPPVRRSEVHELLAAAKAIAEDDRRTTGERIPTVFLGDFNESDGGSALQLLRARGYRDALRRYAPYACTWRWQAGPFPLRGRLDHVLYSKPLRCLDARVLRRGASDHFPVFAVFDAAAPAGAVAGVVTATAPSAAATPQVARLPR